MRERERESSLDRKASMSAVGKVYGGLACQSHLHSLLASLPRASPLLVCVCVGVRLRDRQTADPMARSSSLLVVVVVVAVAALVAAQSCNNSGNRVDCGFTGITQQQCQAQGCCWNQVNPNPNNLPWCFYSNNNPPPPPSGGQTCNANGDRAVCIASPK